jgi:hypothetical protein
VPVIPLKPPAAPLPYTVPTPRPVAPNAAPVKRTVTREQIAKRAYEIWIAKGRPIGQDTQNWQQAERELLAKL